MYIVIQISVWIVRLRETELVSSEIVSLENQNEATVLKYSPANFIRAHFQPAKDTGRQVTKYPQIIMLHHKNELIYKNPAADRCNLVLSYPAWRLVAPHFDLRERPGLGAHWNTKYRCVFCNIRVN